MKPVTRRERAADGTVIDGSARFARHRRRRRRQLIAALSILAALIAFVAVGVFSPFLSVREVRVEGTQRLPVESVQAALADLGDKPLALVTNADIGERLDGMVEVQSYDFRLEPPSTLVVEVTERERLGAVNVPAGYAIVDGAGVTLEQVPTAPQDVPRFELEDNTPSSPGFQAAAAVTGALPDDLRAQVESVQARSLDGVTLKLRDGDTVVWGSAEHSARKAEVFATLRQLTGPEIVSYDVTSPDAPVTRTSPVEQPGATNPPSPAPDSATSPAQPAPPAPPAP